MGRLAWQRLSALLTPGQADLDDQPVLLRPRLVVRGSTGRARGRA